MVRARVWDEGRGNFSRSLCSGLNFPWYFGLWGLLDLGTKKDVVAEIDLERPDFTTGGVAGHSIFVPMPRWWNGINEAALS